MSRARDPEFMATAIAVACLGIALLVAVHAIQRFAIDPAKERAQSQQPAPIRLIVVDPIH